MSARYSERDLEMWEKHVRGRTQTQLAREYGITQAEVSRRLKVVRESFGTETRDALLQREYQHLERTRSEILELWDAPPAPVTVGKDGTVLIDPISGEVVRDHGGRLAAVEVARKYTERMHKLLGLDAAVKVEGTVSGSAAMEELAAGAARRLVEASETED